MSFEIAWVLGVAALALLLFATERLPIDQVAIAIPMLLLLGGTVTPEQALSGLSNPATITVAAVLVIGLGLYKTRAVDAVARWARSARLGAPWVRMLILSVAAGVASAFLNNTAVVAVLLPVYLGVARATETAPSKVLMPLSFMAILGGTVTLIGTSTNLVVAGMAYNRGITGIEMFTFSTLGVVYLAVGTLYMFTLGRWLLPARTEARDLSDRYGARDFDIELTVVADTPAVGETARTLGWDERFGAVVSSLARKDGTHRRVYANRTRLAAGDRLIVRGEPEKVLALAREHGLRSLAEDPELLADADDDRLAEVLVVPGSPLVGRTLRGLRFQEEHEAVVVGIKHHERSVPPKLADIRLSVGDLLLIHGPAASLDALADQPGLVPLRERERPSSRPNAWVALAILVAMVAASASGAVPILVAAMAGAVLMIFVGCVRLEEVYRELDWRVVALLAGLLPLGVALDATGGAKLIATGLVDLLQGTSPAVAILGFYLVASVLTEIMSNAAAAVVLTPVALEAANGLGLNPLAMVAALMFGCSASFMTPTGYQTNTMIYGPGGYRFSDFLRVGLPLNLLLAAVATALIPLLWPSG